MGNISALDAGTVLQQRYVITQTLARGGFAFVYSAYDKLLSKNVAIKELFPANYCFRAADGMNVELLSQNASLQYQDYKNHFCTEVNLLFRLEHHPNIIDIYEIFEENETFYYVMELLFGCTLKQYIKVQKGPLAELGASQIAHEVLSALIYMHQRKILHRDICSSNIFITAEGKIKLIDFGAAVDFSEKQEFSIILKPAYAPPEQYRSQGHMGAWTDLYALGVVLYEILTQKTVPESIERTIKDDLIPPIRINKQISANMNRVIMKALNLDIKKRYQTALEFEADLFGKKSAFDEDFIISKKIKRNIILIILILFWVILCMIGIFWIK